jgi:hypothetical protein
MELIWPVMSQQGPSAPCHGGGDHMDVHRPGPNAGHDLLLRGRAYRLGRLLRKGCAGARRSRRNLRGELEVHRLRARQGDHVERSVCRCHRGGGEVWCWRGGAEVGGGSEVERRREKGAARTVARAVGLVTVARKRRENTSDRHLVASLAVAAVAAVATPDMVPAIAHLVVGRKAVVAHSNSCNGSRRARQGVWGFGRSLKRV